MLLARSTVIPAVILLTAHPVAGHHSPIAFNEGAVISVQGTVTRFDFRNPHVYFYMESTDEAGNIVEWEMESDWTTELRRLGWNEDSLQPGDRISVQAHPARNPQRHYANLIMLEKEDGTVLTSWDLRPAEAPPPPARASTLAGRWLPDRDFPRFFELTGRLANAKGRAARDAFDENQNPGAECVPHPIPQRLGNPHVNDIEVFDDRVVITAETESESRIIYLDGRGHPETFEPTSRGHSVGYWEGDVLVVETVHFASHRSGNGRGLPSGAENRLTERYRVGDDRTRLFVDYVLDDPEYLVEPLEDTFGWTYSPHMDLIPFSCDVDVARRYMEE